MTCFFIGGSQRSGTTLVQTILCQDPSVNPLIQEAKYLRHLMTAYRFGKAQFKTETKDYFKDMDSYLEFNKTIVRSFVKNARTLFPKAQHLALREPHLTMLFPDLAELMPRAKFICVVRDPRDVVASMIQVGERLGKEGISQEPMARLFISRDVPALCRHYVSFYAPSLKSKKPGLRRRMLLVKYEDLVTAPEPQLDKLRKFTGIPLKNFDAGQDPDTGRVDYSKIDKYRKAWATEEYSQKITDARVGSYKKVLSDAEVAAVAENCSGFIQRFKYV